MPCGPNRLQTEMLVNPIAQKELQADFSPFQSQLWAEVKSRYGWQPLAFRVVPDRKDELLHNQTLLLLLRKIGPAFHMAYIPFGPAFLHGECNLTALCEISRKIAAQLPASISFLRTDLPWGSVVTESSPGNLIRILPYSIQPTATVQVQLQVAGGYEQYFRKRARRHIARAAEHLESMVVSAEQLPALFDSWYATYRSTADRQGFGVRSRDYLYDILRCGASVPVPVPDKQSVATRLIVVLHDNVVCAGLILMCSRNTAIYLYGSSVPLKLNGRTLGPAYLLQSAAMRFASEAGCSTYDMHGIAADTSMSSHLKNLDLFKRSFGGCVVTRAATVDYIGSRRLLYGIFRSIELYRFRAARNG